LASAAGHHYSGAVGTLFGCVTKHYSAETGVGRITSATTPAPAPPAHPRGSRRIAGWAKLDGPQPIAASIDVRYKRQASDATRRPGQLCITHLKPRFGEAFFALEKGARPGGQRRASYSQCGGSQAGRSGQLAPICSCRPRALAADATNGAARWSKTTKDWPKKTKQWLRLRLTPQRSSPEGDYSSQKHPQR
jgi:hypothetical protein